MTNFFYKRKCINIFYSHCEPEAWQSIFFRLLRLATCPLGALAMTDIKNKIAHAVRLTATLSMTGIATLLSKLAMTKVFAMTGIIHVITRAKPEVIYSRVDCFTRQRRAFSPVRNDGKGESFNDEKNIVITREWNDRSNLFSIDCHASIEARNDDKSCHFENVRNDGKGESFNDEKNIVITREWNDRSNLFSVDCHASIEARNDKCNDGDCHASIEARNDDDKNFQFDKYWGLFFKNELFFVIYKKNILNYGGFVI